MGNLAIPSNQNSEISFQACNEAKQLGLVVKYDEIEYRDQKVVFLTDPAGDQCFANYSNQLIDLGLYNREYKEDACKFIDRQLDLITDFRNCPNFVGAKLEYFHNGDFRDIRLVYKNRVLKIFLVAGEVNETWIISESERILKTSGLLTED